MRGRWVQTGGEREFFETDRVGIACQGIQQTHHALNDLDRGFVGSRCGVRFHGGTGDTLVQCNIKLYHNAKSDHKWLAQRFTGEEQIYFIPGKAFTQATNPG